MQGFGQDVYEKICPFHDSKIPVKVEIVRNTPYAKPVFNDRCEVSEAKRSDVPYDFDAHRLTLKGVHGKTSIVATLQELLSSRDVEELTYYTLIGKVIIGQGAVKMVDSGVNPSHIKYLNESSIHDFVIVFFH